MNVFKKIFNNIKNYCIIVLVGFVLLAAGCTASTILSDILIKSYKTITITIEAIEVVQNQVSNSVLASNVLPYLLAVKSSLSTIKLALVTVATLIGIDLNATVITNPSINTKQQKGLLEELQQSTDDLNDQINNIKKLKNIK